MLKRMPFERPTEHYDERIITIDEQICALLKQRKEQSENNPGFPPMEYVSKWAATYELYEDFLKAIFGTFGSEEHFRPVVEPIEFRKHIPVLKSVENKECFYTINSIRQYSNASVVTFNIDWDVTTDLPSSSPKQSYFELHIGEPYFCRMNNGGSTSGHASFNYIITPPLPDDIAGIELVFEEYSKPFKNDETGTKITFMVE
ncbi:hypothetical protein MHI37_17440 [Paenibacillus sp. FSL H8-0548]|uniref:hypothetical protein n=1 Tax=Paenibacillus sp. FSL H8-0548 TaxID=1920422 RepID=UPI002116F69F|nr:hypothetical protein [Paenibacillus sp. FSL H8-0548]